jgi:hypothetical protein
LRREHITTYAPKTGFTPDCHKTDDANAYCRVPRTSKPRRPAHLFVMWMAGLTPAANGDMPFFLSEKRVYTGLSR